MKSSLELPKVEKFSTSNYNFSIELTFNPIKDLSNLSVLVIIDAFDNDKKYTLGSLVIGISYNIPDFNSKITIDSNGAIDQTTPVMLFLIDQSIGIARGILYAKFSGSFLQRAFLPFIDPLVVANSK